MLNIKRPQLINNFSNWLQYQKVKKQLNLNQKYKNKYLGKRCFILGNGPSLNKQDLKPLKNQFVITVNSMIASTVFDNIQPNIHIMVDSTKFNDKYPEFTSDLLSIANKNPKPVCVFPINSINYLSKIEINNELEIIYVMQGQKKDKITNIDLTRPIPQYQNVINVALYTAIYLGFTEIYLLGCDMTGFITIYNDDGTLDYGGHFYETENTKEKKIMDDLHKSRSNEFMLKAYGYVFELFRLTNDYAIKKDIKIYNATKGGALDVFPRVKYEDVIHVK